VSSRLIFTGGNVFGILVVLASNLSMKANLYVEVSTVLSALMSGKIMYDGLCCKNKAISVSST
jgi:hypothetical protein